jgi:23S rRNA pseudouridine1911/1915/1917 synthase
VCERFATASLLELTLETGRQHQIRLHLQAIGHPLLGEAVYVGESAQSRRRAPARRQMLHAWRLRFPHPLNRRLIAVEAPLPGDFERLLMWLRSRDPR